MTRTRRDLSSDVAKIFRGIEWFFQAFVSMQAHSCLSFLKVLLPAAF